MSDSKRYDSDRDIFEYDYPSEIGAPLRESSPSTASESNEAPFDPFLDQESDSGDEEVLDHGYGRPASDSGDEEVLDHGYVRPASESDKGEEVLDHGYGRPASESDKGEEVLDHEYVRPASESDKGEEVLDHGYVRPASESDGDEEDFYMVGDNKRWKYFNIDMKHDSKPVYKDKNNILKNVGAIGIFTHGSYYDTHTFIPLPKGLVVNEYASAPDSCYIHGPIFKEDDPYCYSLTKKAVSDLSGCMNRTEYKNAFGHLTEPNIYPELSCNLYLKVKELKGKKYSVNPVEFKIKKDVIKAKKEQEINDLDYFEEYIYKNIKKDNLEDFYFTSDSIVFSFENQISRNDKPLDIDSKTVISIKDIKDLLNEFGKKVLLNKQPTKDLISKEEPQIYQGFINSKYPIYFIYWTYYDKDIRSCYAYKKLGESIYFDGKETNNKINLTQESSEDVKVEKFDFTKNNLEIKGDWINKTGSRFPFKANRIY